VAGSSYPGGNYQNYFKKTHRERSIYGRWNSFYGIFYLSLLQYSISTLRNSMKINHLTAAEENFMKLFWKMESFYLKDVMEQHPEPKPHQNTVSTYLKILVEKGYLSTVKEGRIFKYTVIVPFENYKKFLLKELSHNFFNDSGKEILEFLFNEKLLTQDDLKGYFDLKIEIKPAKPVKIEEPKYEFAEEILNPKKEKKAKSKEKEKEKDKKKKKKKE